MFRVLKTGEKGYIIWWSVHEQGKLQVISPKRRKPKKPKVMAAHTIIKS